MVRRALGQTPSGNSTFLPMQLNKSRASELLVETTTALWNAGHRTAFWGFHRSQQYQYAPLRVPSYAWDKTKHWLALEAPQAQAPVEKMDQKPKVEPTPPAELLSLVKSEGGLQRFIVSLASEEFRAVAKGIKLADQVACPFALYIELASRAVRLVREDLDTERLSIRGLQVFSLLGRSDKATLDLTLSSTDYGWKFIISDVAGSGIDSVEYASGMIDVKYTQAELIEEFNRYKRMTSSATRVSISQNSEAESLRGKVMYKMLAPEANFASWIRGLQSVTALDGQIHASVKAPTGVPEVIGRNRTTHHILLENIFQAAEVHANCLQDTPEDIRYRVGGFDTLRWAPNPGESKGPKASWDITAFTSPHDDYVAYDFFILDAATAELALIILGVKLVTSIQKRRVTTGAQDPITPAINTLPATNKDRDTSEPVVAPQTTKTMPTKPKTVQKDNKACIFDDIRNLLETLADIPKDKVPGDATFDDLGVDSLMMIEVISELSSLYSSDLPVDELEQLTDFNSLVDYLHSKGCQGTTFIKGDDTESTTSSTTSAGSSSPNALDSSATTPPDVGDDVDPLGSKQDSISVSNESQIGPMDLGSDGIQDAFNGLRLSFEKYAKETGASGFWTRVYPQQADLVDSYVRDAYVAMGCDLSRLKAGDKLPQIEAPPRYRHLVAQFRNMLVDSGYAEIGMGRTHVRTAKAFDQVPSATKFENMLTQHPQFAAETKLLHVMGPRLGECFKGKAEPLTLLFGDKKNREILADFYANSKMLKAVTQMLADFVVAAAEHRRSGKVLKILEVGAGTGGTTRYLVEFLTKRGISFEYTFTDLSMGLVSQAKRAFASFPQMKYRTFDCDKPAPPELHNQFHLVLSTNCIHATKNLQTSTSNILPTLREDGALCMLENTRNMYWFDIVFGVLEGWWLFSDGRQHALAHETFWDSSLRAAGYKHVSVTDGDTEEAKTLRLICGFRGQAKEISSGVQQSGTVVKRAGIPMQELVFKEVGKLKLMADVYFPKQPDSPEKKRPIGKYLISEFRTCKAWLIRLQPFSFTAEAIFSSDGKM